MKRRKRKPAGMIAHHVRLTPETFQKLGWFMEERGVNRAEATRIIFWDALKFQKPPAGHDSLILRGTQAERELWESAAKHRGQSLHDYLRQLANDVSPHVLTDQPPETGENA